MTVAPALALALALAAGAFADEGSGEDDGTSWHEHPYEGPGPVLLEAGHVPTAGGHAVLGVRDDLWWHAMNHLPFPQQPVGGYYCQVPPGAPACDPLALDPDLPGRAFCHGVGLWDGDNWHSGMDTWVWVGLFDRLHQQPGNTWCEHARPPTTGVVTHWPDH